VDPDKGIHFDLRSERHFEHREFVLDVFSKFSEGLCMVKRIGDGKAGYIDRAGRVIIPLQYDSAGPFGDGRAWAEVGKAVGLIDKTGRWVVKPGEYDNLFPCGEGLCGFHQGGAWGFLDVDGKVMIQPTYRDVSGFSDGLCLVKQDSGEAAYIDRAGCVRIRLPHPDMEGSIFSEGLARVERHFPVEELGELDWNMVPGGPRCGYISKDGRMAIEPRFGTAGNFSEGLAPVTMAWDGWFTPDGRELVEFELEEIGEVPAWKKARPPPPAWGFIDKKGQVVIPMIYQKALHFRDGLAPVKQGGKWGYIDRQGRMVIGAVFEDAAEFKNGIARVVIDEKVAYINKTGRVLVLTELSGLKF
jgi:hypothetical protein